ncbi:BQ2448_5016 [Microbotryum intermedium]|uniref:BQ2448_5016 protein n=1 Tax=Microbotryum intermedium TaxID=269621 RepID=A0A238F317_9BASI|nr:BQ2448_5016 [Microbotryum intermedium]
MSTTTFAIPELFRVEGLVALITGGGTGIGMMCAHALAQNGVRVYIVGRRKEVLDAATEEYRKLETAGGIGEMIPIVGDTSERESIEKIVKEVQGKEGWLDVLINNAGVSGPCCTVIDEDGAEAIGQAMLSCGLEDALSLFKTNCLGYYYMTAAFLPMLDRAPKGGQIINVTSNLSFGREPVAGLLYAMSKAATTHLTKMLATILKHSNVRCNEIAPGLFPSGRWCTSDPNIIMASAYHPMYIRHSLSEMTAPLLDLRRNATSSTLEADGSQRPKKRLKSNAARTLEFGTADDIACTILYLASKRQRYLSGSVVMLDGGMLNGMPSSY